MATKARGFPGVRCPLCGEDESLVIYAHDMHLACTSCGDDVERRELVRAIDAANALLAWIDTAPQYTPPAE